MHCRPELAGNRELDPFRRRVRNACIVALAFCRLSASALAAAQYGPCAVDDHGEAVTLRHRAIRVTIAKNEPMMRELSHRGIRAGRNLIHRGYYLLNYVVGGERKVYAGRNMQYRLVKDTSEHVEVSLSIDDPATLPLAIDYRFVVRHDSPGVYVYSIWRYPDGAAPAAAIEQSRYTIQFPGDAFSDYAIEDARNGDRFGRFPTHAELNARPQIMDATYRLPDGRVHTKYQHSVYVADNRIHALFDERVGMATIRPSSEFMGGIPDKQEYFIERSPRGTYLHWYEQVRHYGVPNVDPPRGWQKLYGPFLIVPTTGETRATMWAAMRRQADAETERWPYAWLADPLYAPERRGTVAGKLAIADGSSPKGAWVVLGAAQPGNPFRQNQDYLYSTRADADGQFRLPHVRAGRYTLYAQVDGVLGTFRHDGVVVTDSGTTELPKLTWTPATHGERVWQIGTPDRSPREFRHGDHLRQWGRWLDYPLDFPDGVDFVIGESDERTHLNYFHPAVRTPGSPAHLKVPRDARPAVWRIRFHSPKPLVGKATLTFAIAGSVEGSLRVALNDREVARFGIADIPGTHNDASVYRAGVQGEYRELRAEFDASRIQAGENVLTLAPAERSRNVYAGLMYDCIRLEVLHEAPAGAVAWQVAGRR